MPRLVSRIVQYARSAPRAGRLTAIAGLALLAAAAAAPPGLAQQYHGAPPGHFDHGGPSGHFAGHPGGFNHWYGGGWQHSWHNGHWGWWWVVPGWDWYAYAAPVYPYPNPYVPPVAVAPPPGGSYWYYCANPAGYYPYVAQCNGPWRPVVPH